MDRTFERRSAPRGDGRIGVQVIRCGVEGCAEEFVLPDVGRSAMPPDMVSSKARRAGWKVGRGPSRDRCPTHAKHTRENDMSRGTSVGHDPDDEHDLGIADTSVRIRAVPPSTRQVLDTHTVAKDGVVTMRPGQTAPAPIRVMDRDDKRLIYGELDLGYQDAEHGYKPGSSDAGIAESLGVPVLWVRNVREEMFGPADGDKAAKKMIELRERLDALDGKIIATAESVSALMTEAQGVRLELNNLQRKG